MRIALAAAFLLMGLTFTVTQGLVIRALLVAFGGNEITIGVVLGCWLLIEAVGSALAGWLVARCRATRVRFDALAFAVLQTALALLLPATIAAGVLAHTFTGALPGEGVGLWPAFRVAFLLLVPVGLVDGAMFAVGCVAGVQLARRRELFSAGAVYALEALGGIGGGVALTYLFIPLSQPVRAAFVLSALNLLSALTLVFGPRSIAPRSQEAVPGRLAREKRPRGPMLLRFGIIGALLLAVLGSLITFVPEAILESAVAEQWAGHQVVAYDDSVYGNVTVIRRGPEHTFFVDGLPLLTTPNPDIARVEELVHLPLLFDDASAPRRVLVLSGGVGGVLREVLKYPVKSVDYAELDPLLIDEVRRFPTPLTTAELNDPRVTVHAVDGRLLVNEQAARGDTHYDLILVNLPYPTTLQVNRFFTTEFYRAARALLTDEGVFVVPLPGGLEYLGPELTDLHNLVRQALGEVFPHVRPIPGETTLWLASPGPGTLRVSDEVDALAARWEAAGLDAQLITAPYIRYKFDTARAAWFRETLARGRAVPANEDLRPTGVFYGLAYWNALFSPDLAASFQALAGLKMLPLVVLVFVAFGAIWVVGGLVPGARRATVPLAVGTTGFGGMAADVIVIFCFQTLQGHVYHQIGLLIAAFMAGLTAGGLAMTWNLKRRRASRRWLVTLEAAVLGFWVVCPLLLVGLVGSVGMRGVVLPALLAVNVGAGVLVGAEFPLANALVAGDDASRVAGFLYAVDLGGAFAGAILVAVALLPVLGVVATCLLVAALKAGSLLLVATRFPR